MTFDELRFGAWEGTVSATGTVTVEDPLAFELELDARDLSLHSLTNPRGGALPDDPIRMDLRGPVRGHWIGGEDWLEPIAGRLALSMHGGEVPSGDMVESLARALPKHFAERHQPGEEQFMDTTRLEKLEAHFDLAVASHRAETEDLVIVTADYVIEAAGSLRPSGGTTSPAASPSRPGGSPGCSRRPPSGAAPMRARGSPAARSPSPATSGPGGSSSSWTNSRSPPWCSCPGRSTS